MLKAMPAIPPPTELEAALTHVAYEYIALQSAYRLCFPPPSTAVLAAAFDSFLLHYRTLAEFFHSDADWPRRYDDDLRAEDYVPGWKTPTLRKWNEWKPVIHVLLAHLSTRRNPVHAAKTGLDHRRDFPAFLEEIEAAWELLEAGFVGTRYQVLLANAISEHNRGFHL